MKQFNKTHLPDTITYNNNTYKLDREKSHAKQEHVSFDERGCIQVNVMAKNLKGRTDLHGQSYKPTVWIYSKPAVYKVFKLWRKSNRRKILARDLSLEDARKMVNSFPNSQTHMVCYTVQ